MGSPKLVSPNLRILRDGFDPLEIQTDNRDLLLWDRTRVKHKWPKMDEAPFLWMTFLGWAAARRQGAIPADLTYEQWEGQVIDVQSVTDQETETGDPTLPGPGPG